jgi:hypothetical protein
MSDMNGLTPGQLGLYRKSHRRLLVGVSVAVGYFAAVVLLDSLIPWPHLGPIVAGGGFVVIGIVIWAMLGYRCPACKQVPRARMLAFGGGEVTYSSMVALFPRECSSCGVRFKERAEAGPKLKS